ncbi:hypothetical protein ITP53_03270 [Nonomuraea sp. K274]|uniref:Small secreted domain DUF320 n=1 Tax=Nonomuraea cypriaca TaxID=1187855 RepID=A0A931EZ49_9ACTN|nr:hypothetical protein [Nonomuraea cypriaca]MBF8184778.1 hypothetical protein [Nonomuraea cypriaca]
MKRVILSVVAAALVGVAHGAVFAGASDHGTVALPAVDCLPDAVCDPGNLGWQDEPQP